MVDTFHLFSVFSGLKLNLSKCEITGIGVLKRVQVAACGMRCVDLKNDTSKILGTHFSNNEKLKEERNLYKTVTNIQRVLKVWKMRNLTLEGKIVKLKYHFAFVSILWYKENIYVDKNSVYLVRFSEKKINYVSQLLRPDGSIKKWHERKTEHKLQENSYFQWLQLLSAIPEGWKFIIKGTHESTANLIIYYYHVIKASRILTLDKYQLPKYMLS